MSLLHSNPHLHVGDGSRGLFPVLRRSLFFFPTSAFYFLLSFYSGECVLARSWSLCERCACPSFFLTPFLHYYSQRAGQFCSDGIMWKKKRFDSSSKQSLDQEQAGNNLVLPPCSVSCCLPSAAALPSLSSPHFFSHFLHLHLFFLCLSSDPNALGQHGTDHALIGGVVAVVVFVTLCLIIVLGRYLARHKGKTIEDLTYDSQGLWNQWSTADLSH